MPVTITDDYDERVYAGVLGKIIAVYLGRPFEGWTYERIMAELGEITYYVNDRRDVPLKNHLLVVTDDDITGTFVFPRALRDAGPGGWAGLTSADVGHTWMNEIIENQTVLWWGGLGNSTEHTAYLRMKSGVQPPESGSISRNGTVVAEQVGAQIFCEAFAMTCPGDPAAAADLVETAARVSHDGEAINAARVVGALVASAFTETNMDAALDVAMALIPGESLIHRVITDVRQWAQVGDWHATRARIAERYGYDKYGGNCHIVPNHAVVVAALAHSQGDFATAMTVVNTCGWDTDSNAGDVGSICGVFGGLAGIDRGPDWRGPVADRMYLPTADGGSAITDAASQALALAALGRDRAGVAVTTRRGGARFHFALPGSVQGFSAVDGFGTVRNVRRTEGGALEIGWQPSRSVYVATPTFIPEEATEMSIYTLVACPTLYPGQRITARMSLPTGAAGSVTARLAVQTLDATDRPVTLTGPATPVHPGTSIDLAWTVPDTGAQPVLNAGVVIETDGPAVSPNGAAASAGEPAKAVAHLESLSWDGEPQATFTRPEGGGSRWRTGWVPAIDRFDAKWPEPFRIVQNRGTGMLIHGTRDWRNYRVSADVTPHLAAAVGLAARVQGLTRYYALELADRASVRLVRRSDSGVSVLATVSREWEFGRSYQLSLEVIGRTLRAALDGTDLFEITDAGPGLDCGGIALLVTEGRSATHRVTVEGASTSA